MTRSLNKKVFPSILTSKSDGMNAVHISSGKYTNDHFVVGDFCRIGMSDGTLIVFDETKTPSLNVVNSGSAIVKNVSQKNQIIFDDEKVEWIIFGDEI